MELYKLTALDTIKLLKSEEISPLDCLKSLQNRIKEVDQHINALPTLLIGQKKAKKNYGKTIDVRGELYGLPIVVKDLIDVSSNVLAAH